MKAAVRHPGLTSLSVGFLCLSAAIGNSASLPPAEEGHAQLGRIGVVSAHLTPEVAYRTPAKGGVEGAVSGAGKGLALGTLGAAGCVLSLGYAVSDCAVGVGRQQCTGGAGRAGSCQRESRRRYRRPAVRWVESSQRCRGGTLTWSRGSGPSPLLSPMGRLQGILPCHPVGHPIMLRWGADHPGAEMSSTSRRGRHASPIRRIHHKAGPIPCWIFCASTLTASKSARTIWAKTTLYSASRSAFVKSRSIARSTDSMASLVSTTMSALAALMFQRDGEADSAACPSPNSALEIRWWRR